MSKNRKRSKNEETKISTKRVKIGKTASLENKAKEAAELLMKESPSELDLSRKYFNGGFS